MNTTEITVYGYDDRLEETFGRLKESIRGQALCYTSLDLSSLGITQQAEIESAVRCAMQVCQAGRLSLADNFRLVYIGSREGLVPLWELSETAFRLAVLNAGTHHPAIARMQLALMSTKI